MSGPVIGDIWQWMGRDCFLILEKGVTHYYGTTWFCLNLTTGAKWSYVFRTEHIGGEWRRVG